MRKEIPRKSLRPVLQFDVGCSALKTEPMLLLLPQMACDASPGSREHGTGAELLREWLVKESTTLKPLSWTKDSAELAGPQNRQVVFKKKMKVMFNLYINV
jgi:SPRY domain